MFADFPPIAANGAPSQNDRELQSEPTQIRDRRLFDTALRQMGRGIIVLDAERRIDWCAGDASSWLAYYFPEHHGDGLPDRIARWLRQSPALSEPGLLPAKPLKVSRNGVQLVARLLSFEGWNLLLLEEEQTEVQPNALLALGLTPREAEVLALVSMGKTSRDIGMILGINSRTVDKHIEHVFTALGVETRIAAATRALEAVHHGSATTIAFDHGPVRNGNT